MLNTIILLSFGFGCGFKPFPPLPPPGCSEMVPKCVCVEGSTTIDEYGRLIIIEDECHWEYSCAVDTDVVED